MQLVDESDDLNVLITPDTLIRADCNKAMSFVPDNSVDAVVSDPPYQTTQNEWDSVLDLGWMWRQYRRVLKPNGAVVLTSKQPFTSKLVQSNLDWFKYEWIWEKENSTGHLNVSRMPLGVHENILFFCEGSSYYYPIMGRGRPYGGMKGQDTTPNYGKQRPVMQDNPGTRYPNSILFFPRDPERLHPTQKPVALFEYLIRTYTKEGDVVLDNTAGAMTMAVAAIKCNRRYICIEQSKEYFDLGAKRVEQEEMRIRML